MTKDPTSFRVSRVGRALGALLMVATLLGETVAAQLVQPILPQDETTSTPSGWSVAPGVALGGTIDSNVLYRGRGSEIEPDFFTLVNPRATVDYSNRRTRFSADYSGTFSLYSQFDELSSFDQVLTAGALREVTPRLSLSVQGSMVDVPTTEWFPLVGVPFLRVGTQIGEVLGNVDARLSKLTTLTGSYRVVSVDYDEPDAAFSTALIGGWGQGGNVGLRRQTSERLALTANLDLQRTIDQARGTFVVQTVWGGFDYRLTNVMHVSAAAGIARLTGDGLVPSNGPTIRASLTRSFRRWYVDALYFRAFVPSLGIGGTQQNEELQGRVDVTLTRKSSLNASVAWRRNEPLEPVTLRLTSVWVQGGYAYALRPWMRLEAFYNAAHQRIDQPGGLYDRQRVGVQMVTGLPLRIR